MAVLVSPRVAPTPVQHLAPPATVSPTRRSGDLPADIASAVTRQRRLDRVATAVLIGVAVIGGLVLGLTLQAILPITLTWAGLTYATSVLAAVVGTYGVLVLMLLVSRLPVLERVYGQDRLVTWHKAIGPWALGLVFAHIVLVVASYAADLGTGWWAQLWALTTTMPWVLPALAGTLLLIAAGLTSWKHARRRIKYETWWTVHLYTYLAVLLAFAHQITSGGPFLSGAARALWVGLYVAVFGLIAYYRVVVPIVASRRHSLRVEAVVRETDDVVSVIMSGRDLARLDVQPGQFFNWRFDAPGLAYEAHPYSVSGLSGATPGARDRMRITVKALGDSSTALANVAPGTKVWFEGPYGAMTPGRLGTRRVVMVAGGVGVAPIRALADSFAGRVPMTVIYRASSTADLALERELAALRDLPDVEVHVMAGSRRIHPLSPDHLRPYVGRLDDADVYVCGPQSLNDTVAATATALGADAERIHIEEFDL